MKCFTSECKKDILDMALGISIIFLISIFSCSYSFAIYYNTNSTQQKLSYVHYNGIDYGPFTDGQNPFHGDSPTKEQIMADMPILKSLTDKIRIYSSTGIFKEIPKIAKQYNLQVVPTAYLGTNKSKNELEINSLIDLAKTNDNIPYVVVGNEVLKRKDMSNNDLISFIQKVKNEIKFLPVTTSDDHASLINNPDILNVVDVVFVNIHPYNDGISIDKATDYVINKVKQLQKQVPFKKVIVSETGWPTSGKAIINAVPTLSNQHLFLTTFLKKAKSLNAGYFIFQAFDQQYKVKKEGEAGTNWGIYNSNRMPK